MMSRFFLLAFGILLLISCDSAPESNSEPREELAFDPPNILIITADDLGFSDLGCYGSEIATPNLDGLAANGLRSTSFYNAGMGIPTRAALLTGRYAQETGFAGSIALFGETREAGPYQGFLDKRSKTIAEVLKTAGYASYLSGKWHVGENPDHWPLKRGFDRYFGLISGSSSYFELTQDKSQARMMVKDDSPWTPPQEGFYMTDAITDQAVEFLQEHQIKQKDQPFLLGVNFTAPHWPLHAMPEDVKKYKGVYDIGWDEIRRNRIEKQKTLGITDRNYHPISRPEILVPWEDEKDKQAWARKMEVYAAMVDRMDQNVGKIISELEKNGQMNNTLILFLSDNGASAENVDILSLHNPESMAGEEASFLAYGTPWAYVSNSPFRFFKGWVHEGGINSPFIAHWPDIILEKGSITRQVAHVIDLMPTLIQLSRADYPPAANASKMTRLRGQSLLPLFQGKELEERVYFWEFHNNKAVRKGNWKLVIGPPDYKWELFNLENDRNETNNLVSSQSEKFLELRQLHAQWFRDMGLNKEFQ